jgi:hypothetical protein
MYISSGGIGDVCGNLERDVGLGTGQQRWTLIDTLKADGLGHCEARVEKVMSGGAVKAGPR